MKYTKFIAVVALYLTLAACNGSNSGGNPGFGAVTLTPASGTFGCSGPATTMTFTASQANYPGPFVAISTAPSIFTVAPGPGTNQFTVTRISFSTAAPVNIIVAGGGSQSGIFTATPIGCICMRHHDMWDPHLKR